MNLDKILALYQASNRHSPSYMGECDSGATTRGNSPHDKFASPETRDKVLQARVQEIEHFARDRSLPAATVYAIAEASMRTGKIPDLGQYGLAGDDAVATKHFVLSQVLNLQIDDVEAEAPTLDEAGMQKLARRGEMTAQTVEHKGKKETLPGARPQSKQAVFRRESSDMRAIAKVGDAATSDKAKALAARNTAATKPKVRNESMMSALADFMGEPKNKLAETTVPGMPGIPAVGCGRGNANVGASAMPGVQDTVKVNLLPKAIMQKLGELKGVDVTGLSQTDLVRLARDRGLLGTDESVAGTLPEGDTATAAPRANDDMVHLLTAASRGRTLAGAAVAEPASIELTAEASRSEADKLLGIEKDDPRAEVWPKMSPELKRLMNLEQNRYLAPQPGSRAQTPPPVQIEATTMGSVGGMMTAGASLLNQSIPRPSFDASQDLPSSEAKRKQILANILKQHGLRPE